MRVSFDARKGTWSALSSIALMHSFSASKLHTSSPTSC
jgi:predicted membrane metal-binding protein